MIVPDYKPDDALLVVDVQNDFFEPGPLPVDTSSEALLEVLNPLIKGAHEADIPILASRDWHPENHISFQEQGGEWPAHCVQETLGAQFCPGLFLPEETRVISKGTSPDKDQYSPFEVPDTKELLDQDNVECLWVGGVATDVCVKATVLDAVEAGYEVRVVTDATAPVTREGGEAAFREMEEAGAELVWDLSLTR